MSEQSVELPNAEIVQAAAQTLVNAALRLIESDPHQWSTRPCTTCGAVSAIVGRPFGCLRRPLPRPGATP